MKHIAMLWTVLTITALCLPVAAQTDTTFTYQGSLDENGETANGVFDLDFSLWDAVSGGNQVGSTISLVGVPVTDGLVNVELDFDAAAFDNSDRWLEIVVDSVTLSPRQPMTRAPYSIQTRGIYVDDNGRVGIGTTSPVRALQVESTDPTGAAIFGQSTGSSAAGVHGSANSEVGNAIGVRGESTSTGGTGVRAWAYAPTGTTYGVWANASSPDGYAGYFLGRGYFEDSLGIGTTAPAFPLHIQAAQPYVQYEDTGGGSSWIVGLQSPTVGFNIQEVGVGTHFVISEGGRVGIGTTAPSYPLHVVANSSDGIQGETSVNAVAVRGSATGAGGGVGVLGFASATNAVNYGVIGTSASVTGYDFFANGVGIDYGAASSRRWKNNIEDIEDPMHKLSQLRGVYFDWDEEHGGHHDVGMIAEEVGEVLPEIVNYEENSVDAIGMDYSKMTPLLVEAVNALRVEKDQQLANKDAEIAWLGNEVNALERRIEQLETLVAQLAAPQGTRR